MTEFEKTLLDEVAALPKSRRADVLAFIRHLRISIMEEEELERRYDAAIEKVRETAQNYGITEEDVENEIRAVREENASRP
jgi:hypothetical protein